MYLAIIVNTVSYGSPIAIRLIPRLPLLRWRLCKQRLVTAQSRGYPSHPLNNALCGQTSTAEHVCEPSALGNCDIFQHTFGQVAHGTISSSVPQKETCIRA